MRPIRILLQTTIQSEEDDWHIGRFSLLRDLLRAHRSADGSELFEVVARDRATRGFPDPILSNLHRTVFDELWLFGVDTGDGLLEEDCEGIVRFRERGGGVLVTRDHMDLGSSVRQLPEIGAAHHFHSWNTDPDASRCCRDDQGTPEISWPNYHSGANGDYQLIEVVGDVHAILTNSGQAGGALQYLPAHPHEGSVSAPPDCPNARVIARGSSKQTGAAFNIAVAFERVGAKGPAVAQSTFHHFADLNWDPTLGCPSFVTEPCGSSLSQCDAAQADIRMYVENLALWLGGRDPASSRSANWAFASTSSQGAHA
jgi:hypothetical protein